MSGIIEAEAGVTVEQTLHADVVVVGSGAGGATVATTLAEAGLDVICLEEGGHYDTADYTNDVSQMMGRLLRDGGATVATGRGQSMVAYLEGCCVGGTTVVNGGMCWRTPERILDEWVQDFGLENLSSKRLEPLFDEVEKVISARYQDPGSEGGNSNAIKRGAAKLGWKIAENKRNQIHCVGSNDCVAGCPSGAKQSTLQTWLPRFFAAGGRLYSRSRVTKIVQKNGRASGVEGTFEIPGRPGFVVDADAVVLACGATQTPLLLLRNRLGKPCGQVGRHFTIHPNVKMSAIFPFKIDAARGSHQAFQVTEFQEEGILLAPGAVPLAFMIMSYPEFGSKLADQMLCHDQMTTGGTLVDDSASGRISLMPFDIPYINYTVNKVDQKKFIRAVSLLAELYFAAGADQVITPFHHFPRLHSLDDIAKMAKTNPRVADTEYFTAHLMGTCRMHSDPKQGVVGPDGQMFDAPGVYIADASTLPGTIGVNPQVTIMAMALGIAQGLVESLKRRK